MTGTNLDVTAHLAWAAEVARLIAKEYHFRKKGQEEEDLQAVAFLHLCRAARDYTGDPADTDHFRGYAHLRITAEVRREARRLRNGGTYWTRKEQRGEVMDVSALSDLLDRDGKPYDAAAPEEPACLWA